MGKKPEETRVVLIEAKDYLAQVGQVSLLEDDHIQGVKGLEKIKVEPYGKAVLETIPLSEVNGVQYRSIIGIAGIVGGLVSLAAGVGAIVLMVAGGFINFWLMGVSPILILAGLFWIIGCRRRRLIFSCKDREIPWTSGAMEFKGSAFTIAKVGKWAEQRKISKTDFPDTLALLRKGLGI